MLSPGELTPSEGEIRADDETDVEGRIPYVEGPDDEGQASRPFTGRRERAAPVPLVATIRGAHNRSRAQWEKRAPGAFSAAVLQDPITPSQPSSPRAPSSKAPSIDVSQAPRSVLQESNAAPTTFAPNLMPPGAAPATFAPHPMLIGPTCLPPYSAYQLTPAYANGQLQHVSDIQWPYGPSGGRAPPVTVLGQLLSSLPPKVEDEPSEDDSEEDEDGDEDEEDLHMEVFVEEECVWVDDDDVREESTDERRVSKETLRTDFSSADTDYREATTALLTAGTDNTSSAVALRYAARIDDDQGVTPGTEYSRAPVAPCSTDTKDDQGVTLRAEDTSAPRAATKDTTSALVHAPYSAFVVCDAVLDASWGEEKEPANADDRHVTTVKPGAGAHHELSVRGGSKEAAGLAERDGSSRGAGGVTPPEVGEPSSDRDIILPERAGSSVSRDVIHLEGEEPSSDRDIIPLEHGITSLENGGSSGGRSVTLPESGGPLGSRSVTPPESHAALSERGAILPRSYDDNVATMMQQHGDRVLIEALSARLVGVEAEFRSKMALLEDKLMESLNVGAERANELRAMEREHAADKAEAAAIFRRELAERDIEYRSFVVELEAKHSTEVCELREALLFAQHAEMTSQMKLDSEREFFEQDKAEQKRELEELHSRARLLQAERDLLQKQMREQSEQHQKDFQAYERELQKAAAHLLSQARPDTLPAATATVSSFQISPEFDTIGRAF
eukprot:GEMP01025863.1.p1 GENE.GEMP01025863.1~~GEMP01025863.1.p1  ORF type:complete len:731 (+),score=195.98 GEMP01025863.1:62-2254(+)